MKNILLYSLLIFLGFSSCQSIGPIDKAYDEMMVVHDEVMPEVSYMNKLKRKIKALNPGEDKVYARAIKSHELKIQKAVDDMMHWMENVKLRDPVKEMPDVEALEYLKIQTEKISKVSADMKASIAAGESFLEKHQ